MIIKAFKAIVAHYGATRYSLRRRSYGLVSESSSPLDAEIIKETFSNFSEETGFLPQTSLDSVPYPRNSNLVPNPNLESTNRKRGASHISDPSSSKPNKLPNTRDAFIDAAHDNLLNNRYSVHNKGPYVISV